MSRSRKRTPITGITTATSEKHDKVAAHSRVRHRVRTVLQATPSADVLPHRRELSDPWTYAKDGKVYRGAALPAAERRRGALVTGSRVGFALFHIPPGGT